MPDDYFTFGDAEITVDGQPLEGIEVVRIDAVIEVTPVQELAAEDYAAEIGPWEIAADLGAPPYCDLRTVAYLEATMVAPELWDRLIPAILRGFARYLREHGEHAYIDWKDP
jgi:hypothetical protein